MSYCKECGKEISGFPIYAIMNISNEKISRNDYCEECAPIVIKTRDQEFKEQGERKGKMLEQALERLVKEIATL